VFTNVTSLAGAGVRTVSATVHVTELEEDRMVDELRYSEPVPVSQQTNVSRVKHGLPQRAHVAWASLPSAEPDVEQTDETSCQRTGEI